ncbi:energy transducer TonB [Aurantiacibacter aquimixticola]|uniref:energy transducer TonB n=1 Tax=Aurantiacibacter aquimixticola TaxID=1958945 RepID=UPI0014041906|nr:energy transducer TonB [Aurantiacibacter aquimixticola]
MAALGLTFSSDSQAQDEPIRLGPVTNWNLVYDDDSCALNRLFGEEGQRVLLSLRQFAPDEALTTTIASDDFRRRGQRRPATIGFLPDAEPERFQRPMPVETDNFGEGVMVQLSMLNDRQRGLSSELMNNQDLPLIVSDDSRDAREAEIYGLQVSDVFRQDVFLETGSMHPAMNAMRQCTDDMLVQWGVDVAAHRSLLRKVQPLEMDRWVRNIQARYPRNLAANGEQGVVRIRLSVSNEGSPTDCAVQSNFNNPTFDETACRELMDHARFEPALDRNGDPIDSFWQTSVIYQMQ